MSQYHTFAGVAYAGKGEVTCRERFLAEMDAVIPWSELLALIDVRRVRQTFPFARAYNQPVPSFLRARREDRARYRCSSRQRQLTPAGYHRGRPGSTAPVGGYSAIVPAAA